MATTKIKQPANFEDAMRELDALVSGMDGGELALEQALAAYQRGAYLVKYCQAQCQAVQEQMKVGEDGMIRPFGVSK